MYGLIPPKKDRRDFSYKKYFGASFMPPLVDFMIKPLEIKDQGSSDMCVAYAVSSSSEKQEGVALEPAYIFAKTKQLMGNWQEWGSDPIIAARASVKFGALTKETSPYSVDKNGRNFVADWTNWSKDLDTVAFIHKKKAYFKLDSSSDLFNSIVIGLYDNRQTNTTAICGVYWQPEWTYVSGGVIKYRGDNKSLPHAIEAIGQKIIDGVPHLIVQNSWGANVGDGGLYYFPKPVVNDFLFAFALIDANPDDVKKQTWGLLDYLADWLRGMLKTLQEQPIVENPPVTVPPVEKPAEPKISQLIPIAKAIQAQEGWFQGSRSFRNRNPGNIKYTTYTKSLGAIGKDEKGFCVFETEKDGFNGLCRFIQDASNNLLKSYKDCTIKSFFSVYAPSSDKNDPLGYANAVCKKVGCNLNDKLKDII